MEDNDRDRDRLYIGKKQLMVYVLSLVSNTDKHMKILSRGRNISKAVDVYEIWKRRFQKNAIAEITTNTVVLENRNVSEMIIDVTWE